MLCPLSIDRLRVYIDKIRSSFLAHKPKLLLLFFNKEYKKNSRLCLELILRQSLLFNF